MKLNSVARLVVLGLMGVMSPLAFAVDSPMTKIEGADLICEDDGVMFAIDAKVGEERVWQGEPGGSEGIELTLVRFDRARCPNCFRIEADLVIFGQTVRLNMNTRSRLMTNGKFETTFRVESEGEALELSCR